MHLSKVANEAFDRNKDTVFNRSPFQLALSFTRLLAIYYMPPMFSEVRHNTESAFNGGITRTKNKQNASARSPRKMLPQ